MKTTVLIRSAIIVCLAICSGCSKDSVDEENKNSPNNGTMQAKIDGNLIKLNPIKFTNQLIYGSNRSTYACGYSISINVPRQIEINRTYTMQGGISTSLINGAPPHGYGAYACVLNPSSCCDFGDYYESTEATLTFTKITSQIVKGTFSFIGKDPFGSKKTNVANGAFNIKRE